MGSKRLAPKSKIIITEKLRSRSADIPVAFTIAVKNNVKSVKLSIKPVTMPIGLLCPPDNEPERTMGNIGNMQGDRIVTKPAINAKKIKSNINLVYTYLCKFVN